MALKEFAREYGVRSSGASSGDPGAPARSAGGDDLLSGIAGRHETRVNPGQMFIWQCLVSF